MFELAERLFDPCASLKQMAARALGAGNPIEHLNLKKSAIELACQAQCFIELRQRLLVRSQLGENFAQTGERLRLGKAIPSLTHERQRPLEIDSRSLFFAERIVGAADIPQQGCH